MKNKTSFLFMFFLLFSYGIKAQNPLNESQGKMTKSINEYFGFDRENIHLHLNKSTYLNYEDIWFKGYIIEKKSLKPYIKTSNVFVSLLDENGNKLKTNLYYAENSTLTGNFKLDENYKTGVYFVQVYTNYMNNFIEDESSVYKINILNPTEKNYIETKKINYNSASVTFFPESGTFLEGTSNVIAVKIADCNNNAIPVNNAEVFDSKGVLITNFSTDEFGYGKFEIKATKNEIYKVILIIDNKKIEKTLPKPTLKGLAFSVNNYTLANKTSINVKTNNATLNEIKNDNYTLVFQKNDVPLFLELSFKDDKTEQSFILTNDLFLSGINTIHLVDKNFAKIGERNIYISPQTKNTLDLSILKKEQDSISISGISNIPFSEMSISILPNETTSDTSEKNILNTLEFDNILGSSIKNLSYYIKDSNRKKQMELDNVMITQTSKYNWANLMTSTPSEKFDFDMGIAIKGTVGNLGSNKAGYKIKMNSIILGINEYTDLNEQNEFYFDNLVIPDNTALNFSVSNSKEEQPNATIDFQLLKNERTFLKPIDSKQNSLCVVKEQSNIDILLPENANTRKLDNVIVKKEKATNDSKNTDDHAKGTKITETQIDTFVDVLGFIQGNGYNVSRGASNVTIAARVPSTFIGSKSPQIFIDDTPETDLNRLNNMSLRDISEIIINKKGFGGGDNSANGIIKIYTKKGSSNNNTASKSRSKFLTVKEGFMVANTYENPNYVDYKNESLKKYGTIHWIPKVFTDENGNFKFSTPSFYKEKVKIIIEGISSDGRLISEIRTLQMP